MSASSSTTRMVALDAKRRSGTDTTAATFPTGYRRVNSRLRATLSCVAARSKLSRGRVSWRNPTVLRGTAAATADLHPHTAAVEPGERLPHPGEETVARARGHRHLEAARTTGRCGILGDRLHQVRSEGAGAYEAGSGTRTQPPDRKSTRLNSSHLGISYAVFC